MDELLNKTEDECKELLNLIFNDPVALLSKFCPNGWVHSEYITFLNPTPQQQFEENKRMAENLANLSKKDFVYDKTIEDFKQGDVTDVIELDEFLYIMGCAVYHVFSNNHEVIGSDGKIYDLGSARGSGRFIAEYLNDNHPLSYKLDYIDFYLGSIWMKGRGNQYPFYFYIFSILKENDCNWNYSFPRLYLHDFNKNDSDDADEDDHANYKPENAILKDVKTSTLEQNRFKHEIDDIFEQEYEDAKYKPLVQIVKAFTDVYGSLPDGHPQKGFE